MTGHDKSHEYGVWIADEETTPGAVASPEKDPSHSGVTMLLVVIAVVLGGGAFLGVWYWTTTMAKVVVPPILGLTANQASDRLAAAGLADGHVTYDVTRAYQASVITSQSPSPGAAVPAMNPVDVQIAVTPVPVVVPDLTQMTQSQADRALAPTLLTPVVAYAYNTDVPADSVIEQLPRAGDMAVTGSEELLVISLGPGISGTTVPSLTGLLLGPARSIAASATLFAVVRAVDDPSVVPGTVVDQAPSAGSLVPATSNLTLSVALPSQPTTP